MKIKGKIEQIKQSETNKNSYSLLVHGEWYGLYEESGICRFRNGEFIDEEYTQKGKFKNIKPKPVDVDDTEEREKYHVNQAGPPKMKEYNKEMTDKQARSFAVAYAKDLAVAFLENKNPQIDGESDVTKAIIETAKKFYEFIKNG